MMMLSVRQRKSGSSNSNSNNNNSSSTVKIENESGEDQLVEEKRKVKTTVISNSVQNGKGIFSTSISPLKLRRQNLPWWIACTFAVFFLVVLVVSLMRSQARNEQQPSLGRKVVPIRRAFFTPLPPDIPKRSIWIEPNKKINHPIARAFRDRKWTKVNDIEQAQYVWTYSDYPDFWEDLQPWQRYNHINGYYAWNAKDTFVTGFRLYQNKLPEKDFYFIPDSYRINIPEERAEFEERLLRPGGLDHPWVLKEGNVNQGKGITMLGPHSPELKNVLRENPLDPESDLIIQKYVCNELPWDNHRKYDVRMFWFVASIDPLIVLYHDGYVRIGNSNYDESNFGNTQQHLTTHTGLAEEGKATFDEFTKHLWRHKKSRTELSHISDPVRHVRNQFKESIGETVSAFSQISFDLDHMATENGYGFYGADFILDQDLDVWFLEPQSGCGLDEDYMFRVEMHNQLFTTMVDVLDEVMKKEEAEEPILPLKQIGKWHVVYADGWVYNYEGYKRSTDKRECVPTSKRDKV